MSGFSRSVSMIVVTAIFAASAAAQGVPVPTTPPSSDTVRADSARRDSTGRKPLIEWEQEDSVMTALMARKGFNVTRYQGDSVTFNANTRGIAILGHRAGVSRAGALVVGDTITYNESTKVIVALGDTVVLRDPNQGTSDVVSRGRIAYNVASQRGTVTNISTAVESGDKWYLQGVQAAFVNDTSKAKQTRFYAKNGIITSCDDSVPDYYFKANEIKMVSKNMLVARPAILYISEVPVLYLPFMFQDMRSGRRSGILTPRFGVSELFRNSPSYRRHAENIGYYIAMNDYMDAAFWGDWRSGSRPSQGDPGWIRLNGEWRYNWRDRFVSGQMAASHMSQRDGTTNTAISWGHNQDFGSSSHLTASVNYMTNTTVQRQTTFDPRQVLGSIVSQVNFQTKIGRFSPSIGGTRTQSTGRKEVDLSFPSISIPTVTFAPVSWLSWSPSLNVTNVENLNIDQAGEFAFRFLDRGNGVVDSVRLKRNVRNTAWSIGSPIKIAGFEWNNSFRITDQDFRAPTSIIIYDQDDTTKRTTRVFDRTFSTEVDWTTGISLPSLFHGTLNLTPSVSFNNVDGHGFWIRTEQSNGVFVHQTRRISSGLSISPTLFGIFPGFGPIAGLRHSITPSFSWSYAPKADVPKAYLKALNKQPSGYLGNLASNALTLTLSQVFEAKLRNTDSTGTAQAQNVKLLSLNLTPLVYDFERARVTHRSGFSSSTLGYTIASDLLPGFSTNVNYSLYNGDVMSDTARFSPFRTDIGASFALNGQSGLIGALSRLFGHGSTETAPSTEHLDQTGTDALANRIGTPPVAGSSVRNRQLPLPTTQAWQGQFTFTSSRQRPPTGNGTIIEEDPNSRCAAYIANALNYQECIIQASLGAIGASTLTRTTAGTPFIRTPPRESLSSQMSFHVTPKWSAQWGTIYDFHAKEFASQQVTLQRELHDWRAIFGFNQAPNGNFAFNFSISLNAEPDLRFPYDKQTYRAPNR